MQPLTSREITKICEFIVSIAGDLGLNVSLNYRVMFLKPEELEKITKTSTIIEIDDGVCIDPRGFIFMRNDFLANIAVRKLMMGILSLISIENFGDVNLKLIRGLVDKYYDKILIHLYG